MGLRMSKILGQRTSAGKRRLEFLVSTEGFFKLSIVLNGPEDLIQTSMSITRNFIQVVSVKIAQELETHLYQIMSFVPQFLSPTSHCGKVLQRRPIEKNRMVSQTALHGLQNGEPFRGAYWSTTLLQEHSFTFSKILCWRHCFLNYD